MVVIAPLIAAASLVVPALGGAAPWKSLPMQQPVPFSTAPSLGGGLSLERQRLPPPNAMANAITKMGVPLQNMPKPKLWGRDGGHNNPYSPPYKKYVAPCPGEGRDIDGKPATCNYDLTHRACVKLLDDDGKPLDFGDGKTFWDLQRWGWTRPETIASLGGDSSCISMWHFASLAAKVGCENVPLNCAASSLNYMTNRFTKLHVFDAFTEGHPLGKIEQMKTLECIEEKCAKEYYAKKGVLAKYFEAAEVVSSPAISAAFIAAVGGVVSVVTITALTLRRRTPEMAAELLG